MILLCIIESRMIMDYGSTGLCELWIMDRVVANINCFKPLYVTGLRVVL